METVPLDMCLRELRISGGKYRAGFGVEEEGWDWEWRNDCRDSPPVPVAVGSPVCAMKSLETVRAPIRSVRGKYAGKKPTMTR